MFKPQELQVSVNRPRFEEGLPFESRLKSRLMQKMGSSIEGSKNPMAQISTPKSIEEVATKVMQVDKATKLFQTMAIMSLNMGNLNLEVNSLNNRLATGEKEKAIL